MKPKPKKAAAKPKKAAAKPKKAAAKERQATPLNWVTVLTGFKKSKKIQLRLKMGSPGSAQVTRVRLMRRKDYSPKWHCATVGSDIVLSKKRPGGKK